MRIASSVLLVACLATAAAAEPKSWTAVKGHIPASAIGVGTIDVSAAKATAARVVDALVAEDKNIEKLYGLVKTTCKLDLSQVVSDVTILGDEHAPVVVLGLTGTDEGKLVACANMVITTIVPGVMVTSTKQGGITTYGIKEDKDVGVATAWLAKDVVAIYTRTYGGDKHPFLDALVTAKSATTGDLASRIASASKPGAIAWGAAIFDEEGVTGGWGRATLAKGKAAISLHAFGKTAEAAARARGEAQHGLAEVQGEIERKTKRKPAKSARFAAIAAAMKTVTIGGKDPEIAIDAAVDEAALVDTLLGLLEL